MTREQLLEKFDTATGWSTINPIEVLHIARKEFISLVVEMEDLIAKDKLEYKRGWRDRAAQSDLENRTCDGCIESLSLSEARMLQGWRGNCLRKLIRSSLF